MNKKVTKTARFFVVDYSVLFVQHSINVLLLIIINSITGEMPLHFICRTTLRLYNTNQQPYNEDADSSQIQTLTAAYTNSCSCGSTDIRK